MLDTDAARLDTDGRGASTTRNTADAVRRLILTGELRAGDRFTQDRLASRLGLSRTPLRLALERLTHQRMIQPTPGGSFIVRSFSLREVDDALFLRGQLEGAAARLAAERRRGVDPLRELNACVLELDRLVDVDRIVAGDGGEAAGDLEQYAELNEAFHAQLFELAGSDPLRGAYEVLISLPFARPSALLGYQTVRPTLSVPLPLAHAQHQKIVDAITAGDGSAAESLTRKHAELARCDLRAVIRCGAELAPLSGSVLIGPTDA